ncbi:MAG: DUF6265 family protein [Novosphingobium sp.]
MKSHGIVHALTLAGALVASPALAEDRPLPEWLRGTWAMEHGSAWAEEVWTEPRGGMMLGIGREGFGPDVKSWELRRIQRKPDGSISYFAQPKGGTAVEFPMAVSSDAAIEFANAAHDFPQRIRYWREGQLLMTEVSRIDGSDAVRFNYRPVATGSEDGRPAAGATQSP